MMTEREILMRKIAAYHFSIIDMQLYLNTHTNDKAALAKIAELKEKVVPLVAEYERKFGPLRKCANYENKWLWYKNPWPWDNEEDM